MTSTANIDKKFDGIEGELKNLKSVVAETINSLGSDLNKKIGELTRERDDYKSKFEASEKRIATIESRLDTTVKQMEEMSKETNKDVDALKLLEIYLVLMGEVFESATHVRILFILHGAKDRYHLDEVVKSSGMSGLEIKKAVFELRNAGLVDFNEETYEIVLKQRFLSD